MLAKIVQLATTGQLPAYEDMRRETPPGLVALLRVPGLGPKKIKALHDELKIESLADLRAAAEAGKIAALKGSAPRPRRRSSRGSRFVESAGDRILQSKARRLVAPILEAVRGHPARDPGRGLRQPPAPGRDDRRPRHPVQRRGPAAGARPLRHAARGGQGPGARPDQGERPAGRRRPVRPAGRERRAVPVRAALLHRARRPTTSPCGGGRMARGCTLNEYALDGPDGPVACRDRGRAVRRARAWRTSRPSCARTSARSRRPRTGRCPPLIELDDLTGTFHCHTDWSDGDATLEEMAEAARAPGWSIWASPTTRVGGLRGRPEHRAGPPAVGRDRRAEPDVRREVPALQGHRVRHPGRRLARLTPTTCSTASITSWPASTRTFGMTARR